MPSATADAGRGALPRPRARPRPAPLPARRPPALRRAPGRRGRLHLGQRPRRRSPASSPRRGRSGAAPSAPCPGSATPTGPTSTSSTCCAARPGRAASGSGAPGRHHLHVEHPRLRLWPPSSRSSCAQVLLALAGIDGPARVAVDLTSRPPIASCPFRWSPRASSPRPSPSSPTTSRPPGPRPPALGGLHPAAVGDPPSAVVCLLEALLRQAPPLEYTIAAALLVVEHELAGGCSPSRPGSRPCSRARGLRPRSRRAGAPTQPASLLRDGQGAGGAGDDRGAGDQRRPQPRRLHGGHVRRRSPAAPGDAALRRLPRQPPAPRPGAQRRARPARRRHARLRSHRLDAWITSLATRRLGELRAGADVGCHIGSFGYVEDLAPSARRPASGTSRARRSRTPPPPRCCAAGTSPGASTTRASSPSTSPPRRVARALELVEGVRRGHPIGALLGYRFERSLRDRRMTLAQYILPIRQAVPLATTERARPTAAGGERRRARRGRRGAAPRAVEGRPERLLRRPVRRGPQRAIAPTSTPSSSVSTTPSTPCPTCSWPRACTRRCSATPSGPAPRSTRSTVRA